MTPRSFREFLGGIAVDPLSAGAFILVLYVLVGHWSPGRLFDGELFWRYFDLRVLLLLAAIAVTAMLPARPRAQATDLCTLAIAAFFLYLMVSSVFAVNGTEPDYLVNKVTDDAFLLGFLVPCAAFGRHPGFEDKVWRYIFLVMLALLVIALPKFAGMAAQTVTGEDRLSVLGGGPNVLARMAGLLAIAALTAVGGAKNLSARVFYLTVAALAVALVLATGSRGSMVGVAAGLLVLGVLLRPGAKVLLRGALALAAVLIPAYFMGLLNYPIQMFVRRVVVLTLQDHHFGVRPTAYGEAWNSFLHHPFFGTGLASFSRIDSYLRYPHNLTLEFLNEAGGIGFLLFCLALAAAAYYCVKHWKHVDKRSVAAAALYLTAAQASGDLYDDRPLFVFLVLMVTGAIARAQEALPDAAQPRPAGFPITAAADRQ